MSITSAMLGLCQFLYMVAVGIGLAFNALIAKDLSPSADWLTFPFLFMMGSTALLVLKLPGYFANFGYRKLFIAGAVTGILSGGCASLALYLHSFPLFCIAGALLGIYQATALYYRFAAADAATATQKSSAIAWVLTGGILAALLSKYISNGTLHLLPQAYLGSYLALAILSLCAIPILAAVPLTNRLPVRQGTFHYSEITASAIQGILFCSMGYLVMAMVMLASPVAMSDCGFHASDSASVIQWHLMGMFAPSLITGRLIARIGPKPIALMGLLILTLGCLVAMRYQGLQGFHLSLAIVGIGWNFMYMGGSTILTLIANADVRGKIQSLNEFITFGLTTLIAGATGWLVTHAHWIGVLTTGVVCLALVAAAVWVFGKRIMVQV